MALNSVVYKEGKYFVAQCLDIDVSSFGDTEMEALDNLKEALDLYLEDAPTSKIKQIKDPKIHTVRTQHA